MLGAAAMREGKTRIDCYKGIAHKLPDDHEPEDRGGDRGPPTSFPTTTSPKTEAATAARPRSVLGILITVKAARSQVRYVYSKRVCTVAHTR